MKKQNLWKRLVCLMLAVTLILGGSSITAFAADDVMLAYDALSKAFAKFTPSDSTTEQDVLDYASMSRSLKYWNQEKKK